MSASVLECEAAINFGSKLTDLRNMLKKNCRTASLWISYMGYIELLKSFLLAERTSNWLLHLDCLYRMLGLFTATGHSNYAKSVRLYLQRMQNLPESHPHVYSHLLNGMHTIRRSDRLWAGFMTWSSSRL